MKNIFTLLAVLITMHAFAIDPITGPTTVCTGSTITLSDATVGGTWSSSNPAVATVGSSTGIVTGTLSTSTPGIATISYTTATETATMDITVNPTPALTSTLTPPAACDSTLFTYTPTSAVAGTSFAWTRPYVPGIASLASSGTGVISEYLDNTVLGPVTVQYIYTLTAAGCSHEDTVTIVVRPELRLSSQRKDTACSGSPYTYVPTSPAPGATFAWSRSAVTGITSATNSGTGNISETLTNVTTSPINVTYVYTLTAGGCSKTWPVRVLVVPTSQLTSSLTDSVCSGVLFSYVPTSSTPGTVTTWSRAAVAGISNAAVYGTGNIGETLTNTTATTVMVTYVFFLTFAGCSNNQNVEVWVKPCINGVKEVGKQGITIYPNPSKGSFSIFVPADTSEEVVLTFSNATGQIVKQSRVRANSQQTISFDAPQGIYILKATTSTGVYENKVLVR